MRTKHETEFILSAKDKTKVVLKNTESRLKKLGKSATSLQSAFVGLAGAAGLGLMIKSTIDATRETVAYSKALGISTEALSAWQFAGESVGLEAGKIGDIMKDTAEKIGDAFRNNAGEAKEALESLGISIERVAQLSAEKQMLAIAEGLRQVGTQGEKVQILESIASDASLLLPLLEDGAAGLKEMTAEADALGVTLTEIEATKILEADRAIRQLDGAFSGLAQALTVELGPVFSHFIRMLAVNIPIAAQFAQSAVDKVWGAFNQSDITVSTLADALTRQKQLVADLAAAQEQGIARVIPKIEAELSRQNLLVDSLKRQQEIIIENRKLGPILITPRDTETPSVFAPVVPDNLSKSFLKLAETLKTEEQVLAESYLARQQILIDAEMAGIESLRPFDELKLTLAKQHEEQITEVVRKGLSDREKFTIMSAKNQTKTVVGEMVALTQGVAQHNKTLFEVNKAAGIANALIGAYEGFNRTMGAYPYPYNIGLAGLSLAASLAQVNAIRSTSFVGGGAASAPSLAGTGGGAGTINTIPVSPVDAATSQVPPTEVNVTITGGVHDSNAVRELIEAINEEVGDGVKLNATIT